MNRRDLLKTLALAGAGAFLPGHLSVRPAPASSIYLITDRPAADLADLRRLLGLRVRGLAPDVVPVQPLAQDLTFLRDGVLLDPAASPGVDPGLAAWVRSVRARPRPGTALLTLEPRPAAPSDEAVLLQDGGVYARLRLDRRYDRIDVPGPFGTTRLRLEDGRLSVTHAACRHEHCRKMGARATGRIVCAPNRLVALLPAPASGVDVVTG